MSARARGACCGDGAGAGGFGCGGVVLVRPYPENGHGRGHSGSAATFRVVGGEIWFGFAPAPCGGATTTNTDSVVVRGASGSLETPRLRPGRRPVRARRNHRDLGDLLRHRVQHRARRSGRPRRADHDRRQQRDRSAHRERPDGRRRGRLRRHLHSAGCRGRVTASGRQRQIRRPRDQTILHRPLIGLRWRRRRHYHDQHRQRRASRRPRQRPLEGSKATTPSTEETATTRSAATAATTRSPAGQASTR